MSYIKNRNILLLVMISLLLIFTACSNSVNSNGENNTNKNEIQNEQENVKEPENEDEGIVDAFSEPITLRVAVGASEEDFEEIYKKPAEEKFPNLTVEHVDFSPNKDVIEEAFMAKVVPDIIYGGSPVQLRVYEEYELLTDHTELIERHNLDIDLYNKGFIELIRSHSKEGELWALPIDMTRYALHYNKDIFDMFGVPYPEDGMNWQEVVDLAKRVTGERNGQKFDGLMLPAWDSNLSTVSAPLVDPDTDEPLFSKNPQFADLLRLYDQTYLQQGSPEQPVDVIQSFIGDRTLAMLPTYFLYSGWTGLKTATEEGMNWDIATFPVWNKEDPRSGMAGGRWLAVTDYSEHKNEAFAVLQFWLSRDRIGNILESALTAPYNPIATAEMIEELELDEVLKDKNIQALFKYPTLEDRPKLSKYQYDLYPLFSETINEFMNPEGGKNKDINTVLRELNEAAELTIEEEKIKN